MKRILLLFSALMLSCIALWAVEIGGIYYFLNDDKKTAEVTYRGSYSSDYDNEYSGSVTIPETITYNSEIYSVTSIYDGAFSGCSGLTSVTIPNSVTSIGYDAFSNTGIYEDESNWDNGVLYIDNCLIKAKYDVVKGSYTIKKGTRIICTNAFQGCWGLTSVTIPNSVTSIGSEAFEGCSGLTSVTIPNSVTSIGLWAFNDTGIYEDESNWDNGVLYIDNCLINAKSDVVKGSYTIKKGTRIIGDEAFYYCSELTSVTIPNSVTSIGDEAFYYCSELTSVTIPNSVTSIGSWAFYYCSGLTSVTIPNSITSIDGGAFYGCSGLTSVTIPNSVTSIGEDAFYGCSGLTSVTIPNSVTSIGEYAFYGCSGLTSVTIGESVTYISCLAFDECSRLTSVIWNAKNYKDFSYYASSPFYYIRSNITSFTIGNELEHIPTYLCYGMSKLTEITIPNSVTSIGKGAFSYCSGLTSVTIPNSVTSTGENAFSRCSGLTSVTIPNSVTSIDSGAFGSCSGLTSITIPNSVTSIGSYAFSRCSGLTSVTIPNSVTSIGSDTFYRCSELTSVTIPNSVTSIGSSAFIYCSGLTSITIPNSVTSIGEDAFYGCSGLTEVTIGESVTSIGDYAFHGCDKLKKVTAYPTTVPNVYENSFAHYNAYLYVPCDVYEDYDLDDVFGNFKYVKCIAADEVDAPDKVEIDVDNDNNATITWPSTEGAKSYELEITKNGNVFCTLLFNEDGQLTSIDFGNRSASVGFQFTVTGLDSASKYAYSMVAMDKKGNELQSYKGTFTTNGYVPGPGEEDDHVSITETLADANFTVSGGSISADAGFSIYNTIGQNVTAQNGSLQPGVYVVALGEDRVKIMIK